MSLKSSYRLLRLRRHGIAAFGLAIAGLCAGLSVRAAERYTLAIVPQFGQRQIFTIWKPIIAELERRSGLQLDLRAGPSVGAFEQQIAVGAFDFIYANPYHILRNYPDPGYIPLLRDRSPLRGILVVAKDSPVQSPAELDGQPLAVPSFNALGASLLLRADLAHLFQVRVRPVDVKTHSSVYLQVANGLLPAGGGVEKTLQEQEPAVRDRLRVIYTTREMPSHPVAAHPRVPAAVRARLQKAFLDFAATAEGRRLIGEIPMREAVPASIKDYLPMRQWGLDAYWKD